ncbi:MAG TPA: GNAT family N-acetyltransferase [Gaiellales bacterium]|jgi:ribosomal-protein-alanine N-acetyltransferase
MTAWTFTAMTQADAEVIAGWRYPGEYAFYDADLDPGFRDELLDPMQRGDEYSSARGRGGELEGFAQVSPLAGGATEIGLGLRPDLTGRGLGRAFTEAVIDLARRDGAGPITLAVAAFNARAIRVYERCGFVERGRHVRTFEGRDYEFAEMELE